MMCPVRRAIIAGATALLIRNTDFRLVSNTESQFCSLASWVGPGEPIPALFTRISGEPTFFQCATRRSRSGRRRVTSHWSCEDASRFTP